ncbi:MAG: T9SS type A sorting domain-containing protein [Flavihumibacter sp.]
MATTTLKVDYLPNATYSWYFKTSPTDSVLVSHDNEYTIDVLTPDQLGTYVCVMVVNGGCLTRLAYHTLTGSCGGVLPGRLELQGNTQDVKNSLSWNKYIGESIGEYVVERKTGDTYSVIGQVPVGAGSPAAFSFYDAQHNNKTQQYRVKAVSVSGRSLYSNVVMLNRSAAGSLKVYPNPVGSQVHIQVPANGAGKYRLVLYNAGGQQVYRTDKTVQAGERIDITRQPSMKTGIYLLKVIHLEKGEETAVKLMFE